MEEEIAALRARLDALEAFCGLRDGTRAMHSRGDNLNRKVASLEDLQHAGNAMGVQERERMLAIEDIVVELAARLLPRQDLYRMQESQRRWTWRLSYDVSEPGTLDHRKDILAAASDHAEHPLWDLRAPQPPKRRRWRW